MLQTVTPRWRSCIIAASGPSMCQDIADQCKGRNVIVVNDTYKLFPWADVLYCGDGEWWHVHKGALGFEGERWAAYNDKYRPEEMQKAADLFDIKLIYAMYGDGFSSKPDTLHYGANSGYAATNLALHFGCKTIVLTGFDMRYIDGKCHWFGLHAFGSNPKEDFTDWLTRFRQAAATVPDDVRIINATPDSALDCFEMMDLKDALELIDVRTRADRTIPQAPAQVSRMEESSGDQPALAS